MFERLESRTIFLVFSKESKANKKVQTKNFFLKKDGAKLFKHQATKVDLK